MNLNRNIAFFLTLLVDLILLMLGAGTIAFLNVGGVFVFLLEFYFIGFIHRNVFEFLTQKSEKNNPQDDMKIAEERLKFPINKVLRNSIYNTTENLIVESTTLQSYKEKSVPKIACIKGSTIKKVASAALFLIGLCVITLIFTIKTPNKKYGGYLYPIYENGLYGYIDSIGNKVIEPRFLWCSTFSNNKALVVTDTIFREVDDSIKYLAGESDTVEKKYRLFAKYGYIDRSGEFVIPAKFVCYVNMLKDETDRDIKNCSHVFQQYTFRNGRALAYDTLTWRLGYIDKTGSVVIPQKYLYANPFSDSLAIVYEKTSEPKYSKNVPVTSGYLRAGYIDVQGTPITECKYESLTTFNSKRGIGKITEMYSFPEDSDSYSVHNIILNEKGEAIDTLSMFNRYYDYSKDGIAVCEQIMFLDIESIINGPSYEYVNKNGKFLKPLDGMSLAYQAYLSKRDDVVQVWPEDVDMVDVTYFGDGLAGVTPDHEHWYFIDKYLVVHGNQDDPAFENIKGFGNGLCAVKKNGKWGYVNRKMEEIIPFKYDSVGVAYPYLEEAYELNEDGSIDKKYWINRFDSIVWESSESDKIANTYTEKDKRSWGKWTQDNSEISTGIDTRYIYAIIAFILITIVLYFAYKHDYKDVSFKKKYITLPIVVSAIGLCLFCTHNIFEYFFNDYFNISAKSIRNNTSNIKRKNSLDYKCVRYENEGFRSKDSIGVTPKSTKWLEFGIGALPSGKYISTYVGSNTDRYFAGNRQVVRHSRRMVPKYKTVNYGYGIKDPYQAGWKWEDYSYVDYEPVYHNYTWHYALSTFDISDRLSKFCNEDSVYSEYLKDIENQLTHNFGYKFVYTKVDGKKALRYTTYDGMPIKRVIFCGNGRAYVMETKSIDKLNEHSESACSKIILRNFNVADNDNHYIMLSIISLLLGIFFIILTTLWHYKGELYNVKAQKLYKYSILSALLNIVICCYVIYSMYVIFEMTEFNAWMLILSLASCYIVSIPLIVYYKSKEHSDYDLFMIPTWINKFVYSKIPSDVYRKLFITFVIYPLMVISLLPCGIVVLAYAIPALLLSMFFVCIAKWINWLTTNTKQTEVQDVVFKDYYSLLNVPFNASQNDINIAYSSKTAYLNQYIKAKSFNQVEYQDVQEAYRILSTPHIKKIYDEEYITHALANNEAKAIISNQELIKYISDSKKDNILGTARNERFNQLFFIAVIIITSIVFIVKCSSDENGKSTSTRFVHQVFHSDNDITLDNEIGDDDEFSDELDDDYDFNVDYDFDFNFN